MTPYPTSDLTGDWEFKILRSSTGAFGNPEKLRAFLEVEAQAGWTLLEKFDNGRIRLKRPTSAKALDGKLDFDPYRTQVGTSDAALAGIIVASIFGVLILVVAIILAIRG